MYVARLKSNAFNLVEFSLELRFLLDKVEESPEIGKVFRIHSLPALEQLVDLVMRMRICCENFAELNGDCLHRTTYSMLTPWKCITICPKATLLAVQRGSDKLRCGLFFLVESICLKTQIRIITAEGTISEVMR